MLLSSVCFSGQKVGENKIFLKCNEKSLREVLDEIRRQTGVEFIYNDNLIDELKVSCEFRSASLGIILENILNNHIGYHEFSDRTIVLFRRKLPTPKPVKTILVEDNSSVITQFAMIKPVLISGEKLKYPKEAIVTNVEGNVLIKLFIDETGDVLQSIIDSSSGSVLLDSVSLRHSKKLKFTPAQKNGKPRSTWLSMRFEFTFINK